jgi:hypothetical protein
MGLDSIIIINYILNLQVMGKIKDNWQIVVFTMIFTIIGNMIVSGFTSDKTDLKNKADKEYVDKADINLQNQIDKGDENMTYVRGKVDDIYLLLIENK